MKNTFLLLAFLGAMNFSFAQIPNAGFESWTNMGTYDNPDSWGTMNNTTALSGIYTATKGSPGSPGSFYLKLTSKTIGPNVANGIAVSGVLDTIAHLPKSGFPFSLRPQSFTGKWQHMIFGTSAGAVTAILTKWNSTLIQRDTVATANYFLSDMAMSWTNFSIDFNYMSGEFPDSCVIILRASGPVPTASDYLWVDNLAFSGSVAGLSENPLPESAIKVYPNPAKDKVVFLSTITFNEGDKIFITDMSGRLIMEKDLKENVFSISASAFANGTYNYSIINRFGIKLFGSKFMVAH
jgi:hypothetical protein